MESSIISSGACDEQLPLSNVKKKPLMQCQLAFTKRPTNMSTGEQSSDVVLATNYVEVSKQLPESFSTLMTYFELIKVSTAGNCPKYTMKCMICEQDEKKSTVLINDKGITSFSRHLQRQHPDKHEEYQRIKNTQKSSTSVQPLMTSSACVQPYSRNDPRQRRFEQDLINCITLDMQPFNLVEGEGFKGLIHGLDKKINVPHRTSIHRWISDDYKIIQRKLKEKLAKVPLGSLHFILDIWTSQQGKSIIGFKVQFIEDWSIIQLVVGFKHFPDAHTAENIRHFVVDFLGTEIGVMPNQDGSVTADNAANILAAFRIMMDDSTFGQTKLVLESSSPHDMDDCAAEESDECELLDELLSTDDTEETSEAVISCIESWANSNIYRNSCLAHLLHLAVKDTIKTSSVATRILKKITEVVSFFHKSPKWSEILVRQSGGLVLMRPVETRWSSFYSALKKLLQTKNEVNMSTAVNKTLIRARQELSKRSKVPKIFNEEDLEDCCVLMELLESCAEFTNELQSDKVTSSIVILGLVNMIKQILAIQIDEELTHSNELHDFKKRICENTAQRFTTDPDVLKKGGGRGRNIVTVNIFENRVYLVATLLDCRIKTAIFDESFLENITILQGKLPSKDHTLRQLQEEFLKIKETASGSVNKVSEEILSEMEELITKKTKSMFGLVQEVAKRREMHVISSNEIQDYLDMEPIKDKDVSQVSPLAFWKKHENKFPFLAKLAIKYLGMPASSGSVERLFSVAAGMGKARNARLKPETTEMLLCCQSYRLSKLK